MSKDKPLPLFSSDEEAEDFVGSSDLTGYDLAALTPTRFEFGSKDARVNMRMPAELLEQVKAVAASKGAITAVHSPGAGAGLAPLWQATGRA